MKTMLRWACAIVLALIPPSSLAQVQLPPVKDWGGSTVPGASTMLIGGDGAEKGTAENPIVVTGGTGGGGGGGGDASAFNQTTQITAASLTNTRLGDITAPATGSVNQRLGNLATLTTAGNAALALITTTLGTPFQTGGSIGNTAFGISGTLPAFASAPTVNLGTIAGIATAANQTATTAAPGSSATSAKSVQGVTGGLAIDTVVKGTSVDRGSAGVGTTAVTLMAANTARRGFAIQIQSTTATCYVSTIATATADYHSLQIGPTGFYTTPESHIATGAVSIVCSAAATPVFAREW